jgi:OmpA-OmpF porin, OOP family
MRANLNRTINRTARSDRRLVLMALLAVPISAGASAQQQEPTDPTIIVKGAPAPEQPTMPETATASKGPEVKGIISARNDDRVKVTAADGTSTVIAITETTKIRNAGLFGGGGKLGPDALLNGLPVTVKTMQSGGGLVASQISFRKGDMKTASMIRNGTAQQFEEQTAATAALRGRMGDIDKYNVKNTTNVYFDTGKAVLSEQAKAELCNTATQAQATDNALMLVVGYTDSVGSEDFNQQLSEKRAGRVINYLQQACRWQPYRMLTPTGMAESDPAADNSTAEGKAQNRRVSVNILVSKSVDGL